MSATADTAILALLDATVLNVWDGYVKDSDEDAKVVSAALPYVVFYSTPGYDINPRLSGAVLIRAVDFQINFVGSTREQAKWASEKARDALNRKRVTLAGKSRLIRRTDDNLFIQRDDTWTRPGGAPLFFGVDRYVVTA